MKIFQLSVLVGLIGACLLLPGTEAAHLRRSEDIANITAALVDEGRNLEARTPTYHGKYISANEWWDRCSHPSNLVNQDSCMCLAGNKEKIDYPIGGKDLVVRVHAVDKATTVMIMVWNGQNWMPIMDRPAIVSEGDNYEFSHATEDGNIITWRVVIDPTDGINHYAILSTGVSCVQAGVKLGGGICTTCNFQVGQDPPNPCRARQGPCDDWENCKRDGPVRHYCVLKD